MICDAVRLGEINGNLQTWKTSCEDERGRLYLISSIFLKMPCWCQLTTGIVNILCAALADMSAMFVFLCLWPRIPLRILMRSSVFLNNIGKSISLPKPGAQVQKLDSGNILFTALACDGGATPSIPITDCHFDGDATRTERNSLNSSHWNTVYFLEGHKATSER